MSVILTDTEEEHFDAYYRKKGLEKSTLAARLIREHLDREGYAAQRSLSLASSPDGPLSRSRSSRNRGK